MDMDTLISTMAERRGKLKLKLHLLLRLMLRLIPGMDTMADIMDIVIMDMDTPICMAERRGKLKLHLHLLLRLMLRLILSMDTMDTILVDTMDLDILDTLIDMDTSMVKSLQGTLRLQVPLFAVFKIFLVALKFSTNNFNLHFQQHASMLKIVCIILIFQYVIKIIFEIKLSCKK